MVFVRLKMQKFFFFWRSCQGTKMTSKEGAILRFVRVKNLCLLCSTLHLPGSQKVVACLIPAALGRDSA